MKNILNIAGYRFIDLPLNDLPEWRAALKAKAAECLLKGTILLSSEGINIFLAGLPEQISEFQNFLNQYPQCKDLFFQKTWSETSPFKRLIVRLKKEIISMGCEQIKPGQQTAPYITPKDFQRWLSEGQSMTVLDTRNRYEVELGTFKPAVDLNLKHFRHFPKAVQQLENLDKTQPIVTFCTGGIRCEKAALLLKEQGFQNVYQLQGGILNYFNECGGEFFQGKCFVFDDRITIEP